MDTNVLLLLLYVGAALGFSFLCSIAEAVLLSITPAYIEAQSARRPGLADLLRRLKQDNIDRSLAAILTLNTIAHTVGAIGAGAQATVVFGSTWFGVFSAVMTLLILFVSEIVPKTIGAVHWALLAGPTAVFVKGLIVTLYPLVWVSEKLTKAIAGGHATHLFSREEFIAMSRVGQRTGLLNNHEFRVIRNLFRLDGLQARDIMTPRPVMSSLTTDMSLREAFDTITKLPFSRYPLYGDDDEDILGFVMKTDILLGVAEDREDETLTPFVRNVLVVPEFVSLSDLLERLLTERRHIAIVVDEYGGTQGLVTLEDVLETLIGAEIMDESDTMDDMRAWARTLWAQRAEALGLPPTAE